MLVLGRKEGQTLVIGDVVEITVVAVHGDWVRLGVTAPKEVRVLRKEIVGRDEPKQEGAEGRGAT